MANNPYKREIVNSAISILREGKTDTAGQYYATIDDTEFASYATASSPGLQRACFQYPLVLKAVLRDIKPDFASEHYADLGAEIKINKEINGWDLLFELPSNYLDMIAQVSQGARTIKVGQSSRDITYDHRVLTFDSYAHVVKGTDDQAYYCSTLHTAAAANKPITGADYADYWTLYDVASALGADWVSGWSYKASASGFLLATNTYSNDPSATVDSSIPSAYIKYIPYVQAGINDKPQYYPEEFKTAFAVRLASALTKDVEKQVGLLQRYEKYEKPAVLRVQNMDNYRKPHKTWMEKRLGN